MTINLNIDQTIVDEMSWSQISGDYSLKSIIAETMTDDRQFVAVRQTLAVSFFELYSPDEDRVGFGLFSGGGGGWGGGVNKGYFLNNYSVFVLLARAIDMGTQKLAIIAAGFENAGHFFYGPNAQRDILRGSRLFWPLKCPAKKLRYFRLGVYKPLLNISKDGIYWVWCLYSYLVHAPTVLLARLYTRQRRTAVCPAATVRFAGSRTSNRGPSSHFRMFGPEKSPPMWSRPSPPPPPRFIVTPLAAGPAKPETIKDKIRFQKIASFRYASCLLDSFFLDRSFKFKCILQAN